MKKSVVLSIIYLIFSAQLAEARQTTYYTMVSSRLVQRECYMEGNQIVNGQLFGSGSQCARGRGYTQRYCPWGVGNRDNCIVPCVHGVGPQRSWGRRINVQPYTCPWGPLKGRRISTMIVADSGPGHVDVFTGLCVRKQSDRCVQYAPEGTMASYGSGRGREQQVAQALVNQFVSGTMVAALPGSRPTAVAAVAPAVTPTAGTVSRPAPPRLVATTPPIPVVPTAAVTSRPPARRPTPAQARPQPSYSSTLWIEEAFGSMR